MTPADTVPLDLRGGLHKVLRYRDLLWQMVGTDLRGRYVGSALGFFWSVIHPLVMIGIYTLIFSRVMGARLGTGVAGPYAFSIYLCAGLLPWVAFAEVVNRSTGIFLERANLLKKVAFPRVLLHLYVLGAAILNLGIVLGVFLLFLGLIGQLPTPGVLPVWAVLLVLQLLLAAGIGMMTSVLNVFFRDTAQMVSIGLQIWFWLTPIVYVTTVLPESVRRLMPFNVLYLYSTAHQRLLLEGVFPGPGLIVTLLVIPLLALVAGAFFYRASRRSIPDEL